MLERTDHTALFPDTPPPDGNAVRDRLRGVRFEHAADQRLHFRLLAPPGWQWRTPEEAGSPPGLLFSLVHASPDRAEITITADLLQREVNPSDWVKNRLAEAGHRALAERETHGPAGTNADLLTVLDTASGLHLTRTNMVKDGARIFTLACRAREDLYRDLAADFFAVLASFELLHSEKAPLAEPLTPFSYIYPAVVGFRYPSSWQLDEEATEVEECDVRLDSFHDDRCAGRIYVQARPATTRPGRMLADFMTRMRREGVTTGDPALAPASPPGGFERASAAAVNGSIHGAALELRVATFENDAATVLVAVRGPSRDNSPYWWAVNKRAFELVQDSLHAV